MVQICKKINNFSGKVAGFWFILMVLIPCLCFSSASEKVKVKIAILESLSAKGSTASVRYREGLEGALFFALGKNQEKLNRCGYEVHPSFRYYNKDVEDSEKQVAQEMITEEGGRPWMILGMRRSKHFLNVAKTFGFKQPLVSLAANSPEVTSLPSPNFTTNFSVSDLARESIGHLDRLYKHKPVKIVSVIDTSCTFCEGFYEAFKERLAGTKIKEAHFMEFTREDDFQKKVVQLNSVLKEIKPHAMLLPNYSRLSGKIIEKTQNTKKDLLYIGSDGWGNGTYGYLTTAAINETTRGFSVYPGGRPQDFAKKRGWSSLNRYYRAKHLPPATTHVGVVEVIDQVSNVLCEKKPKTLKEFVQVLSKLPKNHFQTKQGLSVFELKGKSFQFSKSLGGL